MRYSTEDSESVTEIYINSYTLISKHTAVW